MQDICLSAAEIYSLTGMKRPSAQLRALNQLGVESQLRANNTVLVYRRHLPGQGVGTTKHKHSTLDVEALAAHVA